MHSFGTLMRFIWRSGKRAAVFVVGVALVVVGLIMFVTPGPGIVLVVAGLAVLATEFAWAEHLLDKAKEQAAKAGRSAQRLPGVGRVTAAAGRLVPGRWRRVTVVTASSEVLTTGGGDLVERGTVTATELTWVEGGVPPGAQGAEADVAGAEAAGAEAAGVEPVRRDASDDAGADANAAVVNDADAADAADPSPVRRSDRSASA
jgi:uncharacterized protein (TIGR02611 family)